MLQTSSRAYEFKVEVTMRAILVDHLKWWKSQSVAVKLYHGRSVSIAE